MRYKSNELKKLEDNRFSVFTDELYKCYFCDKPRADLHEILYGKNRRNSMIYGYVLPLCRQHHSSFHHNHVLTKMWSAKCQEHFEKNHTREEWLSIFHMNYIQQKS